MRFHSPPLVGGEAPIVPEALPRQVVHVVVDGIQARVQSGHIPTSVQFVFRPADGLPWVVPRRLGLRGCVLDAVSIEVVVREIPVKVGSGVAATLPTDTKTRVSGLERAEMQVLAKESVHMQDTALRQILTTNVWTRPIQWPERGVGESK